MMAQGKGRGKVAYADIKKDDCPLAGPRNNPPFTVSNTPEQAMDEYLKNINMYRKLVAKDGSCLFRVVSEQVFNTQAVHQKVRADCINYMRSHRKLFEAFIEGSFEHHLFNLGNLKEWGGHSEISALSLLYKYDFIVYQLANSVPQDVTNNGFEKKIHLCYLNNNHYDCVYPSSFKSNAALAQSILYEILLDNVFTEVDKREMEADRVEECDENPSTWTEVKANKNKAKLTEARSSDNPWDLLISVIPESKIPRISRSLRASLDPSVYHNIEMDVWENCRWEQQKVDHIMAASYQFKPGDICLATIRESKDVSKKVVVKVQKIAPEKCVVMPEDKDTPYYVQLDDLQPIVNGELNDYRSLPGYYNKYENEQEFQSQKRRKHRRGRDEERKTNEFQTITNKVRGAGVPDNRTRGRNNNNRRVVSPTKPQPKEGISPQKVEKQVVEPPSELAVINDNLSNEEAVPKVAKPAETAAAFWGRMRSSPHPTTPVTTPDSQELSDTDTTKNYDDSSKPKSNSGPAKEPIVDMAVLKHKNNRNVNDNAQLQENKDTEVSISKECNEKQSDKASSDAQKYVLTIQASAKVNKVRENILMSSAKIENNIIMQNSRSPACTNETTPVDNEPKIIKSTNNQAKKVMTPAHTVQNIVETATTTTPVHTKNVQNIVETTTTTTPVHTKNFQNIVETATTTTTSPKTTISTPKTTTINNSNEAIFETIESSITNKMEHIELNQKEISDKVPIVSEKATVNFQPNPEKQRVSLKNPKLGKVKKKVSFGSTTEIFEKVEPPVISSPLSSQPAEMQMPNNVSTGSERGKIHIPKDHIEKHMNPTYQQPNSIQQHQYISPTDASLPEQIQQQQQQQQQQQPVRIIPQSSYSHNPIPNTIPTYYHQTATGMYPIMYRHSANLDFRANNAYQFSQDPEAKDLPEDPLVVQYFYNLGVQWCLMSQQNLHRHHQQQQQQINQTGILPLPLATSTGGHVQQVPIHQLVLNPENTRNATDLYVAKAQTPNETLIDVHHQHQQQQQQQHQANMQTYQQHQISPLPHAILQSRLQHQHQHQQQHSTSIANAFHTQAHQQQPQNVPFEEYETPPRLRRGLIPHQPGAIQSAGIMNTSVAMNHRPHRHVTHRHILNGRGIMGQAPKPIRLDNIRPPVNNFS